MRNAIETGEMNILCVYCHRESTGAAKHIELILRASGSLERIPQVPLKLRGTAPQFFGGVLPWLCVGFPIAVALVLHDCFVEAFNICHRLTLHLRCEKSSPKGARALRIDNWAPKKLARAAPEHSASHLG